MKVTIRRGGLPANWAGLPGAVRALGIWDVRVTPRSRLRLKVLVFRTQLDMRRFWSMGLGRHRQRLGPCLGAVNLLVTDRIDQETGRVVERMVDGRYFAVMGLVLRHCCQEVVTHESVHAAIGYAARSTRAWPSGPDHETGKRGVGLRDPGESANEAVCYAAGRIAERVAWIVRSLKV